MQLNDIELATVLAALRLFQKTYEGKSWEAVADEWDHFIDDDGKVMPQLDSDGIDDLCQKINVRQRKYTEDEERTMGRNIAKLLGLRRDAKNRDRWQTAWGNKTDLGLFRTILGLARDIHDGDVHPDLLKGKGAK